MNDNEFFRLLAEAGKLEMDRILSSDEEFDKFLKANPLTPAEEAEVKAMVERLVARIRERY